MIQGVHPIITFVISFMLFFAVIGIAPAQVEQPFDCVATGHGLTLQPWGYTNPSFDIDDNTWQSLLQITGESIWLGYDNGGWDIPSDIRGEWKITGLDTDNNPVEIWIWQSPSTLQYGIFPFDNTELFADANGNHYGIHPCGGWRVERGELNTAIIEIINRSGE